MRERERERERAFVNISPAAEQSQGKEIAMGFMAIEIREGGC